MNPLGTTTVHPILFDNLKGSPPQVWQNLMSNVAVPVPTGEPVDFDPKMQTELKPEEEHIAQGPPGSVLEIKHLDEVYDVLTGQWSTRVTPPSAVKAPPKEGKYDAYAFTVIRKFQPAGVIRGTKPSSYNVITELEVHSEHLRRIGQEAVGHVQGVSWNAKPLRVRLETAGIDSNNSFWD